MRDSTTCRWCDEEHEHSESYCLARNEKKIRSRLRPRVSKVDEAYDDRGKLRPELVNTDMEGMLLSRQEKQARRALSEDLRPGYVIPRNVRVFLNQGFVWNQIVNEKPWAVYVLINGRRRRKRFNNLWQAVEYHSKITVKYPSAGVVSMCRAYELPAEWRLKKDKLARKWKWCPRCAAFRVYHRVEPVSRFYADIKRWNATKGQWEWTNRLIWLTECQLCGHNNRDPAFRRANQPYHVRRIKQGVFRVKATRKTTRKRR